MVLDTALIQEKIRSIQEDLLHLQDYKDYSLEDIAKDYEKHKAIERIIEVIISEAIAVNQHLIVELGGGKLPFDYKESFTLLGELGVLPASFSQNISSSVGLRNILVHQYRRLDEEIFHASITDCLKDYTTYCGHILSYLKRIAPSR